MKIDKNSYGTIALVYLVCVAIAIPVVILCGPLVAIPSTVFLFAVCVWQTLFFRVPDRSRNGSESIVSSVADGEIVIIDKVFENEYLNRECMQVSIYMDFWDVHANFWPISGEVTYFSYHPGKHFLAFLPKASTDNEHTCTNIRNGDGKDVFFKQIAGFFARRIVSYSKLGLDTKASEQCGVIKFGSRVDILLPLDADIKVKLGQKVRACETIIAEI